MLLRLLPFLLTAFLAADCSAQEIPDPVTAKGLIEYYEHKILSVPAESSSLSREELSKDLAERLKGRVLSVSNFKVLQDGEGSDITLGYAMSEINKLQNDDEDDDLQRSEVFDDAKKDKVLSFLIEKLDREISKSIVLAIQNKETLKFNKWSTVVDQQEVFKLMVASEVKFEVPEVKVAEFIEKKNNEVSPLFKALGVEVAYADSRLCRKEFDEYLSELKSEGQLVVVDSNEDEINEKFDEGCESAVNSSGDIEWDDKLLLIALVIFLIIAALVWYFLSMRKKEMSQPKEAEEDTSKLKPSENRLLVANPENMQTNLKEELEREIANHKETQHKLELAQRRADLAEQALHQLREEISAERSQGKAITAATAVSSATEKFYAPWVRGREGFLAGDLKKGKNGKSLDFYVVEIMDEVNGRLLINEDPEAQMRAVQSANTVMNIASAPTNLPHQAKTGIKLITAGKVKLSPDKKEWIVTEPVKIKYI